ncbi:hypothetical protein B0G76_4652 [Paraburkholderia sp. BL23I1N1]|nr:hypothetical protein B0G76_4652 [Paraburkholderia sp. BL23I1N1]
MCDGPDLFDWITTCKTQIFNLLNGQTNSCNGANVWRTISLDYSPGTVTAMRSSACARAQTFQ